MLIALLVTVLDQISKLWAHNVLKLKPSQSIPIFDSFFDLTYAQNTGIAFSLFGNSTMQSTKWILLSVALLTATGVLIFALYTSNKERWLLVALSLLFGGILGNSLDRIFHGAVIDFLHLYWNNYHWPIFNIADSFICIGTSILIIITIFKKPPTRT